MRSSARAALALVLVAAALVAVRAAFVRHDGRPVEGDAPPATNGPRVLPSLTGVSGWLNSRALTPDSLAGHVVVVALWRDTDPRSLRALPDIEAWHRAYARYGVRVIAVHVPEFAVSADSAVVSRLPARLGLTLPIALDPAYRIANELGAESGIPRYVIADAGGRVVFEAGAGDEGRVDEKIRETLRRLDSSIDVPDGPGASRGPPEAEPHVVYLGAGRVAEGPLANVTAGDPQMFTTQFRFQEEGLEYVPYPVGKWTPRADGLTAARGGAANFIAVRHGGGDISAVLGRSRTMPSRVWIMEGNGWLPRGSRGLDVRFDERGASFLDVTEPRVYSLATGAPPGVLRISPEFPGVTVYSIVFEEERRRP